MKPLPVRIEARLLINMADWRQLPDSAKRGITSALDHENPAYVRLMRMGFQNIAEPPRYVMWRVEDGCMSLPRGANPLLRRILYAHGYSPLYTDARSTGIHDLSTRVDIPDSAVRLHDYQEKAVQDAIAKQVCVIRAPTGSGKTTVGIALAARLKLPTLVVVWSSNLLDQWVTRIEKELGIPKKEIGIIKGSTRKVRPITVAMQQTICREPERYRDSFGLVLCDELQRFAAKTFLEAVDPLNSVYRIGISADETRKDKKEFLIYDVFGAVAVDIAASDLIETGKILDVEIRIIPTDFQFPQYQYERNFDNLLQAMSADPERNALIMRYAKEEVQAGEQVFILSHRRHHCLQLDHDLASLGVKTGTLIGGDENKVAFDDARKGLESGAVQVGIGTIPAIGQGLDIPSVSRAVLAAPLNSNRQLFGQVRGRLCRVSKSTGKTDAVLYYLFDQYVYERRSLTTIVESNRNVKVLQPDGSWMSGKDYIRTSVPFKHVKVTRDPLEGFPADWF